MIYLLNASFIRFSHGATINLVIMIKAALSAIVLVLF
jgi:hypothetical protein